MSFVSEQQIVEGRYQEWERILNTDPRADDLKWRLGIVMERSGDTRDWLRKRNIHLGFRMPGEILERENLSQEEIDAVQAALVADYPK